MQEWQEKIEQEVSELKKEVRQLREQRTEEMRVVKVEVASQDVIDRLDTLKHELTQEIKTISEVWIDTLQEHYTEHKNEMAAMEERVIDAIRKYSQPGGNGH